MWERTYQSVLPKTKGTLAPRCPMQMFRLARSDSGSSFLSAMMVFRTSSGWHMIWFTLQILAGLAYPVSGDHLAGISRLKHIAQWCSMPLEGRVQILTLPECVDMAPSAPLGLPEHKVPVTPSWMRTLPGCWHITKYISIYIYIICQSCLGFIATVDYCTSGTSVLLRRSYSALWWQSHFRLKRSMTHLRTSNMQTAHEQKMHCIAAMPLLAGQQATRS